MATTEPSTADEPQEVAVKLSLPLTYQQEIFHSIRSEDQLLILARGLGLIRIITNLLHSYDAAGDNLVLIIGASELEQEWIGESLAEQNFISKAPKARGLKIITTDSMSVEGRRKTYAKGGIYAVTSRILQVDLLTSLLPPEMITGIVVLHAERVTATSSEAFILRLFRQKNSSGFIKAFSDVPEAFSTGFSPLSTMLRNLHLRTCSLWPRFHVTISESLEIKKPEVIELNIPLSDSMLQIQTSILQCIEASLSELKKGNSKELDMAEWNVDSALHKNFDSIVRRQLDPVWHRVSSKTRGIVGDLKELREMLGYLLSYDAVSFWQYLEGVLASQSTGPSGQTKSSQSPWLFLDAAQVIFSTAKARVYTGVLPSDSTNNTNTNTTTNSSSIPVGLHPVLEELPKWRELSSILDEIEREAIRNQGTNDGSYGTVLVMCSDAKECRQLREYLQSAGRPTGRSGGDDVIEISDDDDDDGDSSDSDHGGKEKEKEIEGKTTHSASNMMRRRLRGYLSWKRDLARFKAALNEATKAALPGGGPGSSNIQKRNQESFRGRAPANKRRRMRGGSSAAGSSRGVGGSVQTVEEISSAMADLWRKIQPTEEEQRAKQEVVVDPMEDMEDYFELFEMENLVVVHPFRGDMDDRLLEELRPRWIVMYNPDTSFVRRVEVYRSSHEERLVKVFFMFYGDSVEEQRFLSMVRREKDAFSKLVHEKANMAITLTTDSTLLDDPQEIFLRTLNTRIAGGGLTTATNVTPRVIIDIREFRSTLPSLIHSRRIDIVPVTLTVGDYILSPNICIERKSIKDLIQSFKNGRLYTQCESMCLHYPKPMVLIEFEQNKSFSLEPFSDLSTGMTGQGDFMSLQAKLVLLAIAFPKVRFIWSDGPYQTAEIFEELKKGEEEPDLDKAVAIGLEGGEAQGMENQTPMEMLRAVPGINGKNVRNVVAEVQNLVELSNMEEEEIRALVGKEAARKIHRFFNKTF